MIYGIAENLCFCLMFSARIYGSFYSFLFILLFRTGTYGGWKCIILFINEVS